MVSRTVAMEKQWARALGSSWRFILSTPEAKAGSVLQGGQLLWLATTVSQPPR